MPTKKSILLLLLSTTILMGLQCDKEYVPQETQLFVEMVDLAPAQKVYNVNDTIWVRYISNSKTFLDTISGRQLPSSTIRFGFGLSLRPKYNAPVNPADGFCSFILPANTTAQYVTNESVTATYFNVDCDNSPGYSISIGVVLKHQGIYVLNLPEAIEPEACANQTNPYPASWLRFNYNLSDGNKDVYFSIPPSERVENPVGTTEALIDYKLTYVVKVE